jgi:hypothetical protein
LPSKACATIRRQVRSLKAKVGLLLDKSATDDSLIAALRSPAARSGAYATSQLAFPSSQPSPNQALSNLALGTPTTNQGINPCGPKFHHMACL